MKVKVNYIIIITSLLIMSVFFVWALSIASRFPVEVEGSPRVTKRKYTEDELFKRLEKFSAYLSPNKQEVMFQGVVALSQIGNQNHFSDDSTPFIFSKKGNQFYYKMGSVEYFNSNRVGLSVDHEQREIRVLKKLKSNQMFMPTIPFVEMSTTLKQEGYAVSSRENGSRQTIYLKNNDHFTCKEYALEFDTLNYVPSKIFARLTGNSDSASEIGEQHLVIEFKNFSDVSQVAAFLSKIPLEYKGNSWKRSSEVADFKILGLK